MSIHKEGYVIILVTLLILAACVVLVHYISPANKLAHTISYVLSGLILVLILQVGINKWDG